MGSLRNRLLLVLLLAPMIALAGGNGAGWGPWSGWRAVESANGWLRLEVPDDAATKTEQGRDGGPVVWSEALDVQRGGDVLLRATLYTNPTGLSAAQWLDKHQRHLLTRGASAISVKVGADSGVLIRQPRSPQVLARTVLLAATDGALLMLTCNNSDDALQRRAMARALASLMLTRADGR